MKYVSRHNCLTLTLCIRWKLKWHLPVKCACNWCEELTETWQTSHLMAPLLMPISVTEALLPRIRNKVPASLSCRKACWDFIRRACLEPFKWFSRTANEGKAIWHVSQKTADAAAIAAAEAAAAAAAATAEAADDEADVLLPPPPPASPWPAECDLSPEDGFSLDSRSADKEPQNQNWLFWNMK